MKKPAQYLALFFLFIICYFLFAVVPADAQTPNTNPDVPNNLHTWTQNVMIETASALTCQLTGIDPINPNQKCLGIDQKTGKLGFVEGGGGAIGLMGNLIAMTYTPPFHTSDYFRYLADNFGLAKPAYAQSVGFEGLKPLIGLWAAFRNIVYLLFVLVFVIIGLAIMLRVKIDPRTVMTIENQIPKIIIGLLLVTFSFAIAGFLIDMMYVIIYLLFNIISGVSPDTVRDLNPTAMQGKNAIEAAGGVTGIAGITNTVAGYIKDLIANIFDFNNSFSFGSIITDIISGVIGGYMGIQIAQVPSITIFGNSIPIGLVGGVVSGGAIAISAKATIVALIPYLLAFLIIFIALLWALFRLWFALIQAYVFILIDVVFAPFWILGGLLPGSPVSFGGWLRDILANLSAFPATIFLFLLGKVFIDASSQNSQALFVPPLIGNLSGRNTSPLGAIIGLGVILLAPQVVNMMKDAFKPPPFKYGGAIGQAIGVGPGIIGSTVHAVASPYGALASFRYFGKSLERARGEKGFGKFTGFLKGPKDAERDANVLPAHPQEGRA